MALDPTESQLKRLAYACGMEYGTHSKSEDYFGPRIKRVTGRPEGFVTKVSLDPLRFAGSKVIPTDGMQIEWASSDFELFIPPYLMGKVLRMIPISLEQSCYHKRKFYYAEATYAATHTFGVVERVWLYINQQGFDMELVIESMRLWCKRQEQEHKVFWKKCSSQN